MTVNQFSKTSLSLQADSTTILDFSPISHSTTISASHSDSRSEMENVHYFYADCRDNHVDNQNKLCL